MRARAEGFELRRIDFSLMYTKINVDNYYYVALFLETVCRGHHDLCCMHDRYVGSTNLSSQKVYIK